VLSASTQCLLIKLAVLALVSGCSDPGGGAGGGADGGGGDGGAVGGEVDYGAAFPQGAVARLDLEVSAEAWAAMSADMTDMVGPFGGGGGARVVGPLHAGGIELLPRTPIYVEATVRFGGQSWSHAGLRFKGNSSLARPWRDGIGKLPLRLKMDEFEDQFPESRNQRLFGFQSLGLANGSADESLLHEKLASEIFAASGLAIPATAFYEVHLDRGDGPIYLGLYTAVELPGDESFLDTHFGEHDGNLYKPDGEGAKLAVFDPPTLGKQSNEQAADFADVQALITALNAPRGDAAAWRAGLEAHLDVEGFLTWLAINTVIQDWDQYGVMEHNYYLYARAGEPRLTWIPWDHSYACQNNTRNPPLDHATAGAEWPLIRFLLDDAAYAARYRELVGAAAAGPYAPDAQIARARAAHDLIAPFVVGERGEVAGSTFTSVELFERGLAALEGHVRARASAVATFLGN
jgi:spore coat protein H